MRGLLREVDDESVSRRDRSLFRGESTEEVFSVSESFSKSALHESIEHLLSLVEKAMTLLKRG